MVRILSQYVSVKSILLFLLETALIVSALICAVALRFWSSPSQFDAYVHTPAFGWQILTVVVVFQVCFCYGNLYAPQAMQNRNEQLICLGQSLGIGCLVLGVGFFVFPDLLLGRGVFLISTVLVGAFILASRTLLNGAWHAASIGQNLLVLGTGELAAEVARELEFRKDLGARIVGFLEPGPDKRKTQHLPERRVLGTSRELARVVQVHRISTIIVAMEDRRGRLPVRDLLRLRVEGISVEDAHTTIASLTGRVCLKTVQPSWFVFTDGFRRSRVTRTAKRAADLVLGTAGLLLSLPLMAAVALAVRIDDGGPVLFRQRRVGLRGKHFDLLKFRSMRTDAEKSGTPQWAVKNDPRVTRVGRFIRKYRLDELPQFLNIIRAEMSFVGPRPERPEFVEQLRSIISYYDERHFVRPGLTGWAQVQYPYGATVDDAFRKLEYDLFYLKNMSFPFDCLIVAKTLRIVWTGHGAH